MSGQQIFELVTGMLSGLALFMFGMNVMSDTLTQLAGGRLSTLIERLTEKRVAAWSFGTALSIFVQSSVTTVMTVGLVNSGIMKVSQSLGVMIGEMVIGIGLVMIIMPPHSGLRLKPEDHIRKIDMTNE